MAVSFVDRYTAETKKTRRAHRLKEALKASGPLEEVG